MIKGLLLGLYLAISVGPIVFTVIKQSLDHGWRGGLAFILGIFAVDVFLVVCCNAFTGLLALLLRYERELGFVGSVILIAGGVYYLFFKKAETTNASTERVIPVKGSYYARLFSMGLLLNLLNPGIIAVWLSTATLFAKNTIGQRALIFGVALFVALAADVAKVFGADKLRQKLTLQTIQRINKVNGIIILGFGVVLLYLLVSGKSIGH